MKLSQKGLELIRKFEGFKSCPYLDAVHVPTIGIGTTVYPNGELVKMTDPCIDIAKAYEYTLDHVTKHVIDKIKNLITKELNQNQQDAIISLVYNIGTGNFRKSTVLRLINENPQNKEGITAAFLMWNKAKKQVLAGLTARRKAEAKLFFS